MQRAPDQAEGQDTGLTIGVWGEQERVCELPVRNESID